MVVVREGGSPRGWSYERMVVREDGSTRGWWKGRVVYSSTSTRG